MLPPWKKSYDQCRQHIKKQRCYFANKGPSSQSYGFSSSYVWMWELDYKENWVPNNWCFWTVVLEKTLESPLDCKEIQPVHPKGDQSWVFFGRTDAEAGTPILWTPDVKNWLIWKDPDAGKDWRWEDNGRTGDEIVGWHYQLDAREFEQALGVGDGQGILVCCSPWSCKELGRNEWLNWASSSEKAMAPHSSTLAWKIPWTEEPGRLQSLGSLRVGHDWATSLSLSCIGEGNGNPLQCSCLENLRDGGAW